jgi:hypothetical protein
MWIVIGLIVFLGELVFIWSMCRISAIADRMNEEMNEYNERTGWKWH